jgi:cytoskeletal protein RodZ
MKKVNVKHKDLEIDKNLTIGKILEICRTKNNIKIKDVAFFLKVKERDIVSLEKDEIYSKSSSYINGLIRSYSKLLKIDEELVKEKINSLAINYDNQKKYKLIDVSQSNKCSPQKRYVVYALIFLIISYFAVFRDFRSSEVLNTDSIINNLK